MSQLEREQRRDERRVTLNLLRNLTKREISAQYKRTALGRMGHEGAWLGAPVGLVRADGSPKPSYDALHGLIKGEWWLAPTTLRTDGDGGNGDAHTGGDVPSSPRAHGRALNDQLDGDQRQRRQRQRAIEPADAVDRRRQ